LWYSSLTCLATDRLSKWVWELKFDNEITVLQNAVSLQFVSHVPAYKGTYEGKHESTSSSPQYAMLH